LQRIPHPIPYQGSKRNLAPIILDYFPQSVDTLYEPFAGSAAITLAAIKAKKAKAAHINDSFVPLMRLWKLIIDDPKTLSQGYASIWNEQLSNPRFYYDKIRDEFNDDHDPVKLLFLLARCVKNAIRFNSNGEFNQSPDKRRLGTKPKTMENHILGAAGILSHRTKVTHDDYSTVVKLATSKDLVYMDPPYQGTSGQRDTRYHKQLDFDRFVKETEQLRNRKVPVIISFDGRCGNRIYGTELPKKLGLVRVEIHAGRSSQATLNGANDHTYESLYLSPDLICETSSNHSIQRSVKETNQATLPGLELSTRR